MATTAVLSAIGLMVLVLGWFLSAILGAVKEVSRDLKLHLKESAEQHEETAVKLQEHESRLEAFGVRLDYLALQHRGRV
jgi:hypothetical protein